jgi:hypothetical protein
MLSDFEDTSNEFSKLEPSESTMMNMVYDALINHTEKAIYNNVPSDEKVEALTNVLKYFEAIEEYEKCHDIKNIIQKIEC